MENIATVSRVVTVSMSVGGGERLLLRERCLDSSTCAFLLWLGARCGIAGTGSEAGVKVVRLTVGLLEKKSFVSLLRPKSEKGVSGVTGERSEVDELSALRKLLSILEKSLSEWIESDDEEVVLDSAETFLMSGAVKACTLVVDRNSVGREILARLIVPGAYLTVQERGTLGASSPRVCARARLVKLRTRDML